MLTIGSVEQERAAIQLPYTVSFVVPDALPTHCSPEMMQEGKSYVRVPPQQYLEATAQV